MVYSHIPVPARQNNCLWELKNVKRTTPAILLTCKRVHNEVLSVWGSAWPPTYQLYIPQTLSFKPGPTFQRPGSSLPYPEAAAIEEWCTTVGRHITGRITSLQLVGARVPIPNTPRRTMNKWRPIEADRAAEKIDHVVKHLPKYFQGLKYIEIKLAGWPPMLWERGLVKLVDGIKSIESIKIKTSARDWVLENGEMYLDQGVFDLAMHTGDFLMRRNKGCVATLTVGRTFILTDMVSQADEEFDDEGMLRQGHRRPKQTSDNRQGSTQWKSGKTI